MPHSEYCVICGRSHVPLMGCRYSAASDEATACERRLRTAASPPTAGSTWDRLRMDNPIVAGILRSGGTPQDCCVALAQALEQTANKAMQYMMIAPRRMRLPDGRVMIWRCPDELVPETDSANTGA